MKLQKNLSVRAFLRKIVAGTLLTAALLLLIFFFLLTKDVRVVICGIILTAAFYIWGMVFLHYFQKETFSVHRWFVPDIGSHDGQYRPAPGRL